MKYLEYKDIPHTYVVHYQYGDGLPSEWGGNPWEEREIIFSSDDYNECMKFGTDKYPRPTTWEVDGFAININTSTVSGKALYDKWKEENDARFAYIEAHPEEFNTHLYGDLKIHTRKSMDPLFADINPPSKVPHMTFMMPWNNNSDYVAPIEFYKPCTKTAHDSTVKGLGISSYTFPKIIINPLLESYGAILLPAAGLTHHDGNKVVPKLEYLPDRDTITYTQVFERFGVTGQSVYLCALIAQKKVHKFIDEEWEKIAWRYMIRQSVLSLSHPAWTPKVSFSIQYDNEGNQIDHD